ncbi:hypothetical protein WA026_018829 [Henosepilachna vigintioctopunctata]|uniref:Uncharacterized protein n=1 Tax=Henosepilachna vigintioctopunctata TaxID=420089 RepID=A0AAW1TQS0_9CUCU
MTERAVGIFKQILSKCSNPENIALFLMEYRNTPLPQLGFSPAQLLLNRILKTQLPTSENALKTELVNADEFHEKYKKKQISQKRNGKFINKTNLDFPDIEYDRLVTASDNPSGVIPIPPTRSSGRTIIPPSRLREYVLD